MVTTGYLERDAVIGNLKLHYQEWGSATAPPILMVHGFGVSGHMFDEFAERFQDRYRLIGGMWRISVLGRGIDLSAVAKGRVLLDGDGLRTGVYSTKGVDCRTEPEECEVVPEEETSFVLGTVR